MDDAKVDAGWVWLAVSVLVGMALSWLVGAHGGGFFGVLVVVCAVPVPSMVVLGRCLVSAGSVADALSVSAMLVVCGAVCLVGAVLVAPVLVGLSRVGVAGWLLSWGAALWNARSLVASSG